MASDSVRPRVVRQEKLTNPACHPERNERSAFFGAEPIFRIESS